MKELLVGGYWPLPLLDGEGGHFAHLERDASTRNPACFMELIKGLPKGMSVVEYFGGVGIFTTIIQHTLRPRSHHVYDLDPDCAQQLAHAFDARDGILTARADAHECMGREDADMVVLDMPTSNVRFWARDWPIDRVIERKPLYLIWSDTALRRIGWFRHLYTAFFGESVVSYGDYIRCYNKWLFDRYGYSIVKVTHHFHAYYMAHPSQDISKPIVTKITFR